jgi:O-antigen/teichoic acid export membrane protein
MGLGFETTVFRRAALGASVVGDLTDSALAWYLRVFVPVLGLLLCLPLVLAQVSFAGVPPWVCASAVLTASLSPAVFGFALPRLRAAQALGRFAVLTVAGIVVPVALTVALVIVARLGVEGWALASVVSAASTFALSLLLVPGATRGPARWASLREPLAFSLPLLPHQASLWVTAIFDRVLMIALVGASITGVYSLAYQASAVLGMVLLESNRALMPYYARMVLHLDTGSVARVAVRQASIMIVVGGGALLASPLIGKVLFVGEYKGALDLVGPLLLAQLLLGLYYIPINVITLVRGISRHVWWASTAAAVTNVVLNICLLPAWGAWGAVTATLASYGVLLLVARRLERRHGSLLRQPRNTTVSLSLGLVGAALASVTQLVGANLTPWVTGSSIAMLVLGPGRLLLRQRPERNADYSLTPAGLVGPN